MLAVHGWLRFNQAGKSHLQVIAGNLPNFEYEIKRYHKKRVAGQVIDKPDQRRDNHLMDCLRYLALYNPQYVRPKLPEAKPKGAVNAWRQKRLRELKRDGNPGGYINLGPGPGGRHAHPA